MFWSHFIFQCSSVPSSNHDSVAITYGVKLTVRRDIYRSFWAGGSLRDTCEVDFEGFLWFQICGNVQAKRRGSTRERKWGLTFKENPMFRFWERPIYWVITWGCDPLVPLKRKHLTRRHHVVVVLLHELLYPSQRLSHIKILYYISCHM